MNLARKITHAGKVVNVYFDPEPLNPRKEWDNGTIMVHWHRRYDLGDKRIEKMTSGEMRIQAIEADDPILAILPLNLYDHSGLSVSTGDFSCQFDSGQVGWVYINASKAREMGFSKEYTEKMYEDILREEVKTYDAFLRGEVFGYEIVGKDGETLESCWGFFSQEDCLSEGKSVAEHVEDPAVAREVEFLQSRATYACGGVT